MEQVNLKYHVENMPNKLNTIIGKIDESNIELLLGQWQKNAISRSLVNKAPLKILDEPTSASDPVTESEMYKEYQKLSTNYTTILISHRLGATKLVYKILVLNDGRIFETGTHQEFLDINSLYPEMFNNQRNWYV